MAQNIYSVAQKSLEAAFLLYNLKLLQQLSSVKYSRASSHLMFLLAFLLLDIKCHETFAPQCVLNNELDRIWKEALVTRFLIVLWNLSGGSTEIGKPLVKVASFTGWDLNPRRNKYESRVLTPRHALLDEVILKWINGKWDVRMRNELRSGMGLLSPLSIVMLHHSVKFTEFWDCEIFLDSEVILYKLKSFEV